jgi:protoheme IX farnesyltransferase
VAQAINAPVAASRGVVAEWRRRVQVYFTLTKPRVIELLLITTVPAMILAAGEFPPWRLVVSVLVGGGLAAGGANTINSWVERDRDQLMQRTHSRPIPAGEIVPRNALIFGIVLNVIAFAVLWTQANLLTACLTLSATLFYVFVYTIWLKPRTTQNIVIGGAAGAVPVLAGWAAVTGSLAWPAWILFIIVFMWTPPHFWALAVRYRDDYAKADFPMLPVVKGIPHAATNIVVYALLLIPISLLLGVAMPVHLLYPIAAAVLGLAFFVAAVRLKLDPTPEKAIRLFTFSNSYLALLFAAVALDTLVFTH